MYLIPYTVNMMLGQKIVALIETAAPVCVERFVDYPQLGRFTLRDEGMSLLPYG